MPFSTIMGCSGRPVVFYMHICYLFPFSTIMGCSGRPIVFYIVHLLCNAFLYCYGIFYIATPTKSRDNEEPEKVTNYLTVFTLS